MAKFVHPIDDPAIAIMPDARAVLGGKGAGLAAMRGMGIPVPPAFVVSTDAYRRWRDGGNVAFLEEELAPAMRALEAAAGRRFGDPAVPLLVSVRSGAKISMPGMMDTILNVGACDAVLAGLSGYLGAAAAANVLARLKEDYRKIVGAELPADPREQLRRAIACVFASWDSVRARTYRARADIPDDLGTAVVVQAMVFGVAPGFSGTGVLFTRDPADGTRRLMGDWLEDAQGEDVVSGSRRTDPILALASADPAIWGELVRVAARLEQHQQDMCDIEFTVESGRLWILQYRTGKRSPLAAVRIAVDLATDPAFAVTRETAIDRVSEEQIASLFAQRGSAGGSVALGRGLAASPGTASGRAAFSVDAALELAMAGEPVILVRPETSPQDIPGMDVAEGILTATGGLVSHAAIVAREWRKPAIVGLAELAFDGAGAAIAGSHIAEGDVITIDGTTGEVFAGAIRTSVQQVHPDVETFLGWAREAAAMTDGKPAAIRSARSVRTMLSARDEDLHLDEADPAVNWMENLCFFSFDEARQAGFLIHMKNRPNQGIVEFRLAARVGGATATFASVQPLNGTFAYTDFALACTDPDRRWTIRAAGSGWPIEQVGNVVGMPAEAPGPVPVELDLTWTATIDSLDWKVMKDNESADAPGGRHYDQGGRIAGTIGVGGAEARVDALAYRDHSWGPRNFMQMRVARFIGFVSEDMRTYFDGHVLDLGGDQGVVGFSYTVEDGKGRMAGTPEVAITAGEDWDHGYSDVAIDADGAHYVAHTLWNIAMPLVPERYLSNIAMVRVELPGGRRGFGIVERGRLFTDADLAGWQAAARAPARQGADR